MYALLGGKTKARVPCYATTSRPDLAQQMGFHGAKFPLPYGPEAGAEGLRQNVDFCRGWRERVGPRTPTASARVAPTRRGGKGQGEGEGEGDGSPAALKVKLERGY